MSLNISQLTACTNLATWHPVHADSTRTSAAIILEMLANGKQMTTDDIVRIGKAQRVGCKSHVLTTLAEMRKKGIIRRVDDRRPYVFAIVAK
jgi:predicted transcriptional regulator